MAGKNKVTLVPISFRGGFYGGLAIALCIGFYLIWLWQPERQVTRHTENLFHAIERKDWGAVTDFIGYDYQDQWGDDRGHVLERLREGLRFVRSLRIITSNPSVQVEAQRAVWIGKIILSSGDDEVMTLLDERVNSLPTPFKLEWYRFSRKPWDWELARVSNPAFEIPADVYWGQLISPAPGAAGSWQIPHPAAVAGKARSPGVYLPGSSGQ
ncbi:MAG: hypothetical protein C5B58_05330 [Acidobacteria bacterium]|nr:MAG: hypothetical protein C5B58_05330 [Acidobacteriota bacterium]